MDNIKDLRDLKETFWINKELGNARETLDKSIIKAEEIEDARARLNRFKPLFMALFEETKACDGIIESPLIATPKLKNALEDYHKMQLKGELFFKARFSFTHKWLYKGKGWDL